jgi:hypothetical protein
VYLSARRSANRLELDLTGEWRLAHFVDLDRELSQADLAGAHEVVIATPGLETLDLSASWALRQFVLRAEHAGARVEFVSGVPEQLQLLDACLAGGARSPSPRKRSKHSAAGSSTSGAAPSRVSHS